MNTPSDQKFNPETQFTTYPVCPSCGSQHTNAWEWDMDDFDNERECWRCGEPFICTRIVTVEYCTCKKP